MATNRITMRVLGAIVLLGGFCAADARAQITAESVLKRTPVQPGVIVSTPTGADLAACKAEEMEWPAGQSGIKPKGVKVVDGAGKMLRQFIDTTGTGKGYNIFSFYVDGVESYRELDSNANGKPDSYRWLGVNGSKWGSDANEDGTIDEWYAISPEEVSQELFAAIRDKNPARFLALVAKEDDFKKMKLPAVESAKFKARSEGAGPRFGTTVDGLKLTDKAKFVHVNYGAPQATPADTLGIAEDLLRHRSGTLLVDKGDGKMELFQSGDLVQVGRAWKLLDGPAMGGATETPETENTGVIPKEIEIEAKQLIEIPQPKTPAEMAGYHLARAKILEVCVSKTKGTQQTPWLKQMIDAYQGVVESDASKIEEFKRLELWKGQIFATPGATEIKPYVLFRMISAEYAVKLKESKGPDALKTQTWYRDQLEAFVKAYDKAEDTPEALMRLATASEFAGKEGEAAAKNWYEKLAKDHPAHVHAAKAMGAVKRLTSEGQPFFLAGTTFDGKPFTQALLAGKPAVVFYWASWAGNGEELKALSEINKAQAGKLNIVTVCLDDDATKADAIKTLQASGLAGSGLHLHAAGGLDNSPLAKGYGIQMVPHIFLVDNAGKVANRNAQGGPTLKDDIEKLLK